MTPVLPFVRIQLNRLLSFLFGFVRPLFQFGLHIEAGAKTLFERKPPMLYLLFVSILMRWNSSCGIFYIARIVRQREDGGAIQREFSY